MKNHVLLIILISFLLTTFSSVAQIITGQIRPSRTKTIASQVEAMAQEKAKAKLEGKAVHRQGINYPPKNHFMFKAQLTRKGLIIYELWAVKNEAQMEALIAKRDGKKAPSVEVRKAVVVEEADPVKVTTPVVSVSPTVQEVTDSLPPIEKSGPIELKDSLLGVDPAPVIPEVVETTPPAALKTFNKNPEPQFADILKLDAPAVPEVVVPPTPAVEPTPSPQVLDETALPAEMVEEMRRQAAALEISPEVAKQPSISDDLKNPEEREKRLAKEDATVLSSAWNNDMKTGSNSAIIIFLIVSLIVILGGGIIAFLVSLKKKDRARLAAEAQAYKARSQRDSKIKLAISPEKAIELAAAQVAAEKKAKEESTEVPASVGLLTGLRFRTALPPANNIAEETVVVTEQSAETAVVQEVVEQSVGIKTTTTLLVEEVQIAAVKTTPTATATPTPSLEKFTEEVPKQKFKLDRTGVSENLVSSEAVRRKGKLHQRRRSA